MAPETKELTVAARWGDYEPVQQDGKLTGEWKRTERLETVTVKVSAEHSGPISKALPNGDGLEIVTSVRTVKGLDDLPDLPKGTRAVSVFLVNRRDPEDAVEFKDRRFAFQAQLTLDSSSSFVPRPNSRGRQADEEWDERVADLQYRDVMEFAVGQGHRVFKALSDRMAAVPSLQVQLFLHVGRDQRDTRYDSEILREFADKLRKSWPGQARPFLYYDPRSLSTGNDRATWHAKVVVIDDETSFVTSANFTQWAQDRNVEAGVLIRNAAFARQLRQQFDSLVQSRAVIEVPGFR